MKQCCVAEENEEPKEGEAVVFVRSLHLMFKIHCGPGQMAQLVGA